MTKHVAIYERVSSKSQSTRSQRPDLERWAKEQSDAVVWYSDTFTGKTMDRPGWRRLAEAVRGGRVTKLVCWKLDRLGRTARELLGLFDELQRRKVDLVCTAGGIPGLDTPEGRLMAGIIAQFAEYDNEVRSERIRAGQAVARANGKTWGGSKPGRKKVTPVQVKAIRQLHQQGESIVAIAHAVKLSRPTIYDVIAQQEAAS